MNRQEEYQQQAVLLSAIPASINDVSSSSSSSSSGSHIEQKESSITAATSQTSPHLLTNEEFEQLRLVFNKFDETSASGDGRMTVNEYKQLLQDADIDLNKFSKEQINSVIERSEEEETNEGESGVINFYLATGELLLPEDEDELTIGKLCFELFDKNGNGTLEHDELCNVMKLFGTECSKEEVLRLLNEFDSNHDGVLNFEEFMNFRNNLATMASDDEDDNDDDDEEHHGEEGEDGENNCTTTTTTITASVQRDEAVNEEVVVIDSISNNNHSTTIDCSNNNNNNSDGKIFNNSVTNSETDDCSSCVQDSVPSAASILFVGQDPHDTTTNIQCKKKEDEEEAEE